MRRETARAQRVYEVRCAARAWKRAGAIDEAALASITAAYADDRTRTRPVFRVLFFLFTAFAVFALFGMFVVGGFGREGELGPLSLLFGAGLVVLTEVQMGPWKRERGGTEEATAFAALVFLVFGVVWIVFEELHFTGREGFTVVLCASAVLTAAAAWRWASPLAAVVSMALAFWMLARLPYGRELWMLAGAMAFLPLLRGSESPRPAPGHRRACAAALIVGIAALYVAVSIYSLDHWIIEAIGDRMPVYWSPFSSHVVPEVITGPLGLRWTPVRIAHALLTAVLPVAFLVWGLRTRRRFLIDMGGILAALSLATIREYVHVAAPWLILAAAGAGVISLALALRRWLDAGAGKERGGITAEPLYESAERRGALAVAATLAAFAPAGRRLSSGEPKFEGKGGSFGGGGANGEF